MPEQFRPEYVLRDILMAYGSGELVRGALQGGIITENTPNTRGLTVGEQQVMVVTYTHADPWQGRVNLDNIQRGYSLQITTLQSGRL